MSELSAEVSKLTTQKLAAPEVGRPTVWNRHVTVNHPAFSDPYGSKVSPDYDMERSKMNGWIEGYSGTKIFPLALTPDQVKLEDIAHALSLKCRFTGHCKRFYSVGEHSVRCSYLVPPEWAKEALMHDAAEYVLPDVARPIKHMLPGFKEIERRVETTIAIRFGLVNPAAWPDCIKAADNAMVLAERLQLMPCAPGNVWDVPGEPADLSACGSDLGWPAHWAEMMFSARAEELDIR